MSEYIYKGQQPKTFELIPKGDYNVTVAAIGREISAGQKTAGCNVIVLKLQVDGHGQIQERLIVHDSCDWKIDCFLQSCGLKPAVGQPFRLDEKALVGLKGRARIGDKEPNAKGFVYNEVVAWLLPVASAAKQNEDPDWGA